MKKILVSMMMSFGLLASYAQNPTVVNTATNQGLSLYPPTRHTGIVTLGINTNGASSGYFLGWITNTLQWAPSSISTNSSVKFISYNQPAITINSTTSQVLFVDETIPSGKTVIINRVRVNALTNSMLLSQNVKIKNYTSGAIVLSTNLNWDGNITFTNLLRYQIYIQNDNTNSVNASASAHGLEF